MIPTNKANPGDILLVSGKPKCVIEADKNKLTVINYEDSTIETVLPERHMFMGNTYFYGKIVSMFGNDLTKGKGGANSIMKYMMLSRMMKNTDDKSNNTMLALMMMGGNSGNIFDGMFDFDEPEDEELEESEDE